MNNKQKADIVLKARADYGCMYVCRQMPEISDTFNNLWASSLLLSASKTYCYIPYRDVAVESLEQINNIVYQQNKRQMIVVDGHTRPIWDAMYVRCLFKNGQIDQAIEHCRGISWLETHRDHNGVLVATYLDAFHHSKDEMFLDWARKTRTIATASERLSAFDAWGLALLAKEENDIERCSEYLLRMFKTADIRPRNMVGIVGPVVLQLCLAYKYLTGDKSYDKYFKDVLKHQTELQASPDHTHGFEGADFGAFVQSKEDRTTTRIDYTISSSFAILCYVYNSTEYCF